MENVRDNMEHAYEHAPEFFGNVIMLYIVRGKIATKIIHNFIVLSIDL